MTNLSQATRAFRSRIEDETAFLTSCEGGDPGTPEHRSIWLLGIEPGWSLADEAADDLMGHEREEKLATYAVEQQLEWPFNRNAFKLLSALAGGVPQDYQEFAMSFRPFERGSTGYFKANLFPEPCNNVGEWTDDTAAKTGFATKAAYRSWLRENRFRVMTQWIERCRPRLVIGSGLTHLADFLAITRTSKHTPAHRISVNGHTKRIHVSAIGTVPVAVIPHLSGGPHSLNSNLAIGLAAAHIRTELGL